MPSKQLRGLYAVTDVRLMPDALFQKMATECLQGGARIIQYRHKPDGSAGDEATRLEQANFLRRCCNDHDALLIINDDIELAQRCDADGVHLGREDTDLASARERLGAGRIIGISCYDDISRATTAEANGADYVAFGAVYPSPTKPAAVRVSLGSISDARQRLDIPVCVIGGIDSSNADPVLATGCDMIAVISGIFAQPDIRAASEELSNLFR